LEKYKISVLGGSIGRDRHRRRNVKCPEKGCPRSLKSNRNEKKRRGKERLGSDWKGDEGLSLGKESMKEKERILT